MKKALIYALFFGFSCGVVYSQGSSLNVDISNVPVNSTTVNVNATDLILEQNTSETSQLILNTETWQSGMYFIAFENNATRTTEMLKLSIQK